MRVIRKSLRQTMETLLQDLKLFGSLCVAQFIVWRTLRRQRKEREFRLRRLALVRKRSAEWREAANT
jgi:hypothetical protein